ncbi:glycosyltransferase family 2 protein [Oecophyllibacter saccharovorans]|uniref:glycosyltransferase family 2 protein n=1 Tax=Oecophyllibacter saccharovorans TaxID=2558360 RepID=UPI001143BB54|nr:glycosyltransferase family 2 protein [Oecophyllibacter saccharovorans]QDH15138.1 glycosyltransferase family 2 protein [Oecophyllibacter saccharovorans]
MSAESLNIAVASFVKNEFSDIAGWIAWHLALGVKTFFVFDDHSSDGTWELLQAAAKHYDIRLFRTDPLIQPDFYWRQRDSFMQAAEESKGEFDWIGFLDGDEYIYLPHYDSLPEFLKHFDHADGIAFSWRIQGSANRVIRPHVTTVEAFPQHSTEALGDNGLVKSFVRPEKMGDEYVNPHWFDVATERYVRPSGRYVSSANAVQDIEWTDGFVLHYICRSMEHYIQRIKRRLNADLSDSIGYWDHFNRNDVTDYGPHRLLPKMDAPLGKIYEEAIRQAVGKLKDGFCPIGDADTDERPEEKALTPAFLKTTPMNSARIYRLRGYFGLYLYYSPEAGKVLQASEEVAAERGFIPLYGSIHDETPDLITLFIPGQTDHILRIPFDDRLARKLVYRLKAGQQDSMVLSNPMTGAFMAFHPPVDELGKVETNRHVAQEWEQVHLELVLQPSLSAAQPALPFVPDGTTSFRDILVWLQSLDEVPENADFMRVLYSVSPSVQEEVSRCVPGQLWNAL